MQVPASVLLVSSALVAALGGLLFGYDTAVIAGAQGFLQEHFALSDLALGWVAASALVGCMLGSVMGGWFGDRFGRKKALLFCAVLFLFRRFGLPCQVQPPNLCWHVFLAVLALAPHRC